MDAQPTLRVVAYKEGDTWVAQCLEYDIGAQAPDLDELWVRFSIAFEAEKTESSERHGEPFAGIAPAPTEFKEMWERAGPFRASGEDDKSGAPMYDMALRA
ncbi:MAG: hypothetical protein HY521_04375 [Proteobacteria bacterium]|nr:hypothetical protein [Pseudomonadota bacterium]